MSNGSILNTLSGSITRARSPAPDSTKTNSEKPAQALNQPTLNNAVNTDTVTISKAARALSDSDVKPVEPVKSINEGAVDKSKADETKESAKNKLAQDAKSGTSPTQLSEQDAKQVQDLKKRDVEVRRHEAAHLAAAGKYASGGPSYDIKRGPDGKNYAVGGEVGIDTSPVAGDPQATLQKAQQVRAAAQAPANPSSQDRQVAASASQMETEARREIASLTIETAASPNKSDSQETENVTENNATSNAVNNAESKAVNNSVNNSVNNAVNNAVNNTTTDIAKNANATTNAQDQTRATTAYQQIDSIAKTQNDTASLISLVA